MIKHLGIVLLSLLFTVGSVQAEQLPSIFTDSYSNNAGEYISAINEISEQEMKNIDGKWYWIPVALAVSWGVRYCSHYYYDSSGFQYFHWSCF